MRRHLAGLSTAVDNQADVALVPDAVGAADDVVDDVGVDRVEAAQGLGLRAGGGDQVGEIAALDLEDGLAVRCGSPGGGGVMVGHATSWDAGCRAPRVHSVPVPGGVGNWEHRDCVHTLS